MNIAAAYKAFRQLVYVSGVLILPGVPFLDRSPVRHPVQRKLAMGMAFLIVVAMTGLSIMGYREHFATPPQ